MDRHAEVSALMMFVATMECQPLHIMQNRMQREISVRVNAAGVDQAAYVKALHLILDQQEQDDG